MGFLSTICCCFYGSSSSAVYDCSDGNDCDAKRIKTGGSRDEYAESKAEAEANSSKQVEQNATPKPPEPSPKPDYIHVRARSGQATDSHSLAERNDCDAKRIKTGGSRDEYAESKAEAEANSSKLVEQNATPKPPEPSPKPDYIHVRARRGQATDSHSLAERARREKISERMKTLQDLVPGCNKVTGKALLLDEIINYVQSLQRQVEFLSMKLVNPRMNPDIEGFPLKDAYQQVRAELRDELREEMHAEFTAQLEQMRAEMLTLMSQDGNTNPNKQVPDASSGMQLN